MEGRRAKAGDTVRVHYSGKRSDGVVFDESVERGPIEVTIGSGQVIAGFDGALVDMAVGDAKSVTLDAANAYGPHDPRLVHEIERERLPEGLELSIGAELQASDPDGNQLHLVVVALEEASVTLDANHPLAGEDLTFDIELVEFLD